MSEHLFETKVVRFSLEQICRVICPARFFGLKMPVFIYSVASRGAVHNRQGRNLKASIV
jgi:hypothetical protein